MTPKIALVSQSTAVATADVIALCAAIQTQITQDFLPVWKIPATISYFATLEDVHVGFWPVIIVDKIATKDFGVHGQRDNQPIALVDASKANWQATVSHEVLEMIVDPYCNRLVASSAVMGSAAQVEYLVEICDPCQNTFYNINGIKVSNFYTPNYFDAATAPSVRYDFLGLMTQPRTILEQGYLSWIDPISGHLHRADMVNSSLWLTNLGDLPPGGVSLRSYIDSKPSAMKRSLIKKPSSRQSRFVDKSALRHHQAASKAKAARLRMHFASLRQSLE